MMAGANRDALLIECAADFFGAETVEYERQHPGLFRRSADQAQAGDVAEGASHRVRSG